MNLEVDLVARYVERLLGTSATRSRRMSFAPIPELLEEIRAGRMVVIVDDEDRENEGDLIMAAELVQPGRHQLHGHARARPGVPVADARALPPARPAADGARQHLAAPHQLHRLHRSGRRRHHRHLRLRPRAHHPHRGAPGRAAAGPVAARPHLPADWRSPAACSTAPATPRRPAIWRCSRAWNRPACWSRSSTPTAAWRGARSWKRSRASTA